QGLDQLPRPRRQDPAASDLGAPGLELVGAREAAVPEEEADLLEARLLRELVDVDPAVGEDPLVPVDVADRRIGGDDVLESLSLRHAPFSTAWGMTGSSPGNFASHS